MENCESLVEIQIAFSRKAVISIFDKWNTRLYLSNPDILNDLDLIPFFVIRKLNAY